MSKYIVIPNIKVSNANALPVWWIVSAPAPTAYVGFAHALALKLGSNSHKGVAIIHHDIQFLGEQLNEAMNFLPHQYRAAGFINSDDHSSNSKQYTLLSSQPTARCHIVISLVIAMDDDAKLSSTLINAFLRGGRIAGGTIISHGEVYCGSTNYQEALSKIKKESAGKLYSIVERQDLMVMQENDRDILDVLLRNTRRNLHTQETQVDKAECDELTSTGWIVPTCLGYVGISTLEERNNSRNNLPHLYVEPLVGLVQYQSVKNDTLYFWRYSYPQSNIFIITQNKGH